MTTDNTNSTTDTTTNNTNSTGDIMTTSRNSITNSLLNSVQSAREATGFGRGYSVLFKVAEVIYSARDIDCIVTAIEDGGLTSVDLLIAPCSKQDSIKHVETIAVANIAAEQQQAATDQETTDQAAVKAATLQLGMKEVPFGAFVWWNMRNVKMTPNAFRSLLKQHRFDAYTSYVKDIDINHVISLEGKKWKLFIDDDRYSCGIAASDKHTITFGIKQNTLSSKNGTARNDDLQVETVVWDLNSKSWIAGGTTDVSKQFVSDMSDLCTYHYTKQIRPIIQRIVQDMNAISLKDQGGFYLVAIDPTQPEVTLDRLSNLMALTADLGNSIMSVATQTTPSAKIACQADVTDHLSEEIVKLEEKVERWMANTKHTASDALDRAVVDFKDIRGQARLFAMALELRADGLLDRIDEMESQVLKLQTAKPTGKDRTVCTTVVDHVRDLLASSSIDSEGFLYVDIDDIAAAKILPDSAYTATKTETYWKRLTSGGKAARQFGYRGVGDVMLNDDGAIVENADDSTWSAVVFQPFGTATEKLVFADSDSQAS